MTATLRIVQLEPAESTAEASVAGTYDYVDRRGGRTERRAASFRATLRREGSVWRVIAVR